METSIEDVLGYLELFDFTRQGLLPSNDLRKHITALFFVSTKAQNKGSVGRLTFYLLKSVFCLICPLRGKNAKNCSYKLDGSEATPQRKQS